MQPKLAPEWIRLESTLGERPKLSGTNVQQIRKSLADPALEAAARNRRHDPALHIVSVRKPRIPLETKPRAEPDGCLTSDGGGFCVGDLNTEDVTAAFLCKTLSLTVVSVGYGLAPEAPWPAALEDCCKASHWLSRHFQADHVRIFGRGTLALSTAIKLAQDGIHANGVAALAPLTIDTRAIKDDGHKSRVENAEAPILSAETLNIFLGKYRAARGI
ncbi:hypothetical protein CEP51_005004 [Fusarium floridanum]|uniref:Alpha/beta hydrolase fold-3 domain-containing protein n=1 Tax=Fusarium floridanum TaxID=1325733 RepID=A0A428RYT0_9HYPO|nr:hypothetical protein CEP51_005004 [Fusarium floridanum]